MNKLLSCHYNMDTNRVEARFADGTTLAIDCIAIEDEYGNTPAQRAELDWLLYNKPLEYVQLVLSGEIEHAKLYEDVSKGLLPEKRFQMLADRYDKEQAELTEKIEQYEREGRAEHDQLDKIQDFIDEVSKYAGITELNYKILHQLIDKILVSKAEKVDGEYVQKIQIFYRFIGPLDAIE